APCPVLVYDDTEMSKRSTLGLEPDEPIPRRPDGRWDVSRAQLRLLDLLFEHDWLKHPRYSAITQRQYLLLVVHELYRAPDQVIELLTEELEEQERCRVYEPSVSYLRKLARAALAVDYELAQIISATGKRDGDG